MLTVINLVEFDWGVRYLLFQGIQNACVWEFD